MWFTESLHFHTIWPLVYFCVVDKFISGIFGLLLGKTLCTFLASCAFLTVAKLWRPYFTWNYIYNITIPHTVHSMETHTIGIEYTCRHLQFVVRLELFLAHLQLLSTPSIHTLTSYVLNTAAQRDSYVMWLLRCHTKMPLRLLYNIEPKPVTWKGITRWNEAQKSDNELCQNHSYLLNLSPNMAIWPIRP